MKKYHLGSETWVAPHTLRRRCEWCNLPILTGDRYRDALYSDGERDTSQVTHDECDAELERLGMFSYQTPPPPGLLADGFYDEAHLSAEWKAVRWARETLS